MRSLRTGTYIFSDIEHLSPDETELAEILWQTLARSGPHVRLLNSPLRSMKRYELLRRLYELGVNDFNVYRLTEARQPERFPVFIRGENDHSGPITHLLHTQAQLDEAIQSLMRDGKSRDNKIIVEYCDVSDAHGVYHKHGAFVIGDAIIPRSLLFSRNWVVKGDSMDSFGASYIDQESCYLEENPHASLLRPIFATADIQYGRMDYAIVDGEVRVFEINTNPTLYGRRARDPARLRASEEFARNFEAALQAIDCLRAAGKSISLAIPRSLVYRPSFPLARRAIHETLSLLGLLEYEDRLLSSLKRAWVRVATIWQ